MKKLVACGLAVFGFIYLLGIVGSYDYADEVVYSMDAEIYEVITKKIGKASNKAVADEYMKNKQYYDSINYGF